MVKTNLYNLARRIMSQVQGVMRTVGLHVDLSAVENVPDRSHYRPYFQPWTMPEWEERLGGSDLRTLVTFDRRYVLYNLLSRVLRSVPGEIAEAGVYRGGTAKMFADLAGNSRPIHLFDTFTGMPETDPMYDLHKAGDFADSSLLAVREYLANYGTVFAFHAGLIPHTLGAVADRSFCFVHIDLDIYRSILDATQFFYGHLNPGGVIVYDDYGFSSCPGARRAVDEFFSDKSDTPIVLPTAQAIVFKLVDVVAPTVIETVPEDFDTTAKDGVAKRSVTVSPPM